MNEVEIQTPVMIDGLKSWRRPRPLNRCAKPQANSLSLRVPSKRSDMPFKAKGLSDSAVIADYAVVSNAVNAVIKKAKA